MAPPYKLTYFNVTALGEPIRLILSYGKIDFEDCRIQHDEKWPQLKETLPLPFGQMPILEHEGKVAHQSVAICRYAAKQAKLVGNNDWEDLEIDAAVDTINDLRAKIATFHYEQDSAVKEKKKANIVSDVIPYYLSRIEEQIKKNNGYLAAGRLTWADLFFVGILDYLNFMVGKDLTNDAPGLKGIREKVVNIPQIKAWIEKRPKTNF